MTIDWDVPIVTNDGVTLRADVYRPTSPGPHPVLMTYGPYAKGLPFEVGYPKQWEGLLRDHPEVAKNTSSRYANWETVDPERWVPMGYVCVRVDSRGCGRSPGFVDPFCERETDDYFECIEWAGTQPWSNGKVGLLGVSYYAMNQWMVAAKRPPHLVAICPFEGASDFYRDACRHGGVLSTFWISWYPKQVMSVQHGLGQRGHVNPNTGEFISGPLELSDEELQKNRIDIRAAQVDAELITDPYFQGRVADLERIEVPVLSCGNWGGQGLHLRGNVEGYRRAGSKEKWLEMHGLEHWTEFYTDYGVNLQRRFFDHYLKGEENGWGSEPPLQLQIRHVDKHVERKESEWPLARTQWTKLYLGDGLSEQPFPTSGVNSFDAMQGSLNFALPPLPAETEVTGPVAAKIFARTTAKDLDVFLTLRAFAPDGKEHLIVSAVDPKAPITQGWLRASHRKLDVTKSKPYQPIHAHDELLPVEAGETYELDVELWPTSFVYPKGYQLVLTISGSDFTHGLPGPHPLLYGKPQMGSSVFLHDDPLDRSEKRFSGTTTVLSGGETGSYLLLPIIPSTKETK